MSDILGKWNTAVGRSGVVGIHAALLHSGQVIFYARPEDPSHNHANDFHNGLPNDPNRKPNDRDETLATVIDLYGQNAFKPYIVPVEANPFCSALTFLHDGRLFVAGGDRKCSPDYDRAPVETKSDGRHTLRVFVPGKVDSDDHGHWEQVGRMPGPRWYPSCAQLPDGRVFIISGYLDDMWSYNNQNPTCELYPPLPGGPQYLPLLANAWPHEGYPFVFVLPSGSVFLFARDQGYNLRLEKNKFGKEKWVVRHGEKLPDGEPAKQYPNSATAVLLPLLPDTGYNAEVLVIGGAGANVHPHFGEVHGVEPPIRTKNVDARRTCFRMKVDPAIGWEWSQGMNYPGWQQQTLMTYPRVMPDAVLLPDGTVLVVNGASKGYAGGNAATGPALHPNAVKHAELFNPITNSWRTLEAAEIGRMYHSTALLLPDATVLIAGSDHQKQMEIPGEDAINIKALAYEYRIDIFEPPYLFNGNKHADRPEIKPVDVKVAYRQQFKIEVVGLDKMDVKDLRVAFLRPGAVTHSNNMSQRYVALTIIESSSPHLVIEAPPNGNVAPPGYYMLFLLHRGVPSKSIFIQLLSKPSGGNVDYPVVTSKMMLWLRADEGVVMEENADVISWADLSGNGNDVFLKTDTGVDTRPFPAKQIENELNGHAVVRFTLTEVYRGSKITCGACLETRRPFMPGSTPYSVLCVIYPWPQSNRQGWGDLVGWGDYSQPHSNAFVGLRLGPAARRPNGGELPKIPGTVSVMNYWNVEWQGGNLDKDPLLLTSAPVLIEMFYDGAFTGLRMNGYEIKRDPAPSGGRMTGDGPLTIGLNGGKIAGQNGIEGAFYRGDIAEIIIYEKHLEGKERYDVQQYLRNKYALW